MELVNYCAGSGLDDQKKFREELWYQYIRRVTDWAVSKGIDKSKVWCKLRKENAPGRIRMFLFMEDDNYEKLIDRLRECETSYDNSLKTKNVVNLKQRKFNNKRCYKCGKRGHIQNNCWSKQENGNININNIEVNEDRESGIRKVQV